MSKYKTSFDVVDLGLSVQWATCNLGADVPEGSGKFFSWGEVEPKEKYDRKAYSYYVDENEGMQNAYGKECDAAYKILGYGWRIPTKEEFRELLDNCEASVSIIEEVTGVMFVSRINGKKCFFPFCGSHSGRNLTSKNSLVNYWSSTASSTDDMCATAILFNKKVASFWDAPREYGFSIRPVLSENWDGDKMFQSEIKSYPESQYSWRMRKSGPKLTKLYYVVLILAAVLWGMVCFNFDLSINGRIFFIVLLAPPALVGALFWPQCFRKNDINNS